MIKKITLFVFLSLTVSLLWAQCFVYGIQTNKIPECIDASDSIQLSVYKQGDSYRWYRNDTLLETTTDSFYYTKSEGIYHSVNVHNPEWRVLRTGAPYAGLFFVDTLNGWMSSSDGIIKKTSDGGRTWINHYIGSLDLIESLFFFDKYKGFGAGSGGTIVKTIDGGKTWTKIRSVSSEWIEDITFRDSLNGVAVGWAGLILITTDGGATWKRKSSSGNNLMEIAYQNDSIIWVVGNSGSILKSNNGGNTWLQQTGITTATTNLHGVFFSDSLHGWIVGLNGTVLKTVNGGVSWLLQPIFTTKFLYGIKFINNLGIAWAENYIFKTTDTGSTWTSIEPQVTNGILETWLTDENRLYICGWAGLYAHTKDGGITWPIKDEWVDGTFDDLYFLNKDTGIITGYGPNNFRTTDGGRSWKTFSTGTNYSVFKLSFYKNSGIGASQFGKVALTKDGGVTWSTVNSPVTDGFVDASMQTDSIGYVASYNKVLKSIDGGSTWSVLPSTFSVSNMCFINKDTGWIAGGGNINITKDGGNTWQSKVINANSTFYGMFFINERMGWVVGVAGKIFKTDDGGNTWTIQYSGTTKSLTDVWFNDSLNGCIVGYGGTILRTHNGGATWLNESMLTEETFKGVQMVGDVVYAVHHLTGIVKFDSLLCSSENYSLNITYKPKAKLLASSKQTICNDSDTISLFTDTGYTYIWYKNNTLLNADSAFNIIVFDSGYYKVMIKNEVGCMTTDSVFIKKDPVPIFTIVGDTLVTDGSLYIYQASPASSLFTYQWLSYNGEIQSGQYTPNITVRWVDSLFGRLTLVVSNTEGCTYADSINIKMQRTTGINNSYTPVFFSATPNPFENQIWVHSLQSIKRILIYDIAGRNVLDKMIHDTNCLLNTEQLPHGIFVLSLVLEDNTELHQKMFK